MADRKAVIKNADMSEDMQQDAIDCATQALEKYNIEKDIAAFIKKEFDKKYNPTWHCIVGRNFGSYVTHETKHFIYFYLGQVAILLFKSGARRRHRCCRLAATAVRPPLAAAAAAGCAAAAHRCHFNVNVRSRPRPLCCPPRRRLNWLTSTGQLEAFSCGGERRERRISMVLTRLLPRACCLGSSARAVGCRPCISPVAYGAAKAWAALPGEFLGRQGHA